MDDLIDRQAAIDAANKLVDRFEQILRDIRETNEDESVCGLCEYDGAFIGQSGDWCNECPGFEKDDCFRLSDECRKRWLESAKLPSAQPEKVCIAKITLSEEQVREAVEKAKSEIVQVLPSAQADVPDTNVGDLISRQAAIDAIDIAIERYDEMAEEYQKKADIERNDYMDMRDDAYEARQLAQWLNELKYLRGKIEQLTIKPEQRWIPCNERLPEEDVEVLITYRYKEGEGDTSHADIDITTYGQMYFGGNKVGNHKHWRQPFEYFESNYEVVAWMPLPESYKDGEHDE